MARVPPVVNGWSVAVSVRVTVGERIVTVAGADNVAKLAPPGADS